MSNSNEKETSSKPTRFLENPMTPQILMMTAGLLANPAFAQNASTDSVGPIMHLPGHTGAVMCIAFSPNGKFAATHGGLGDHSFHLWDITQRKQVDQVG